MSIGKQSQWIYYPFVVVIVFFSWLMIQLTIPYFTFKTDVDFLLVKQNLLANTLWMWSFYLHIGFSPVVLLSGLTQFHRPWQVKWPVLHRYSGYVYASVILLFSAPSGLIMAFYANGGWAAKTSFVCIATLWWYFTFRAIRRIRNKNIPGHQHDMMRSYALTLSAITLRLYVFLLPMISDIRGVPMYVLVSWLSWIPNLLLVELWIRIRSTDSYYIEKTH
jgi:uncharacterized membrane protein